MQFQDPSAGGYGGAGGAAGAADEDDDGMQHSSICNSMLQCYVLYALQACKSLT